MLILALVLLGAAIAAAHTIGALPKELTVALGVVIGLSAVVGALVAILKRLVRHRMRDES